jgi:hypothetical protein
MRRVQAICIACIDTLTGFAGARDTNWDRLSAFYKYPPAVRKIICTTNPIGSYHRVTKSKGPFSSEDAIVKQIYLATINANTKWSGKIFGSATGCTPTPTPTPISVSCSKSPHSSADKKRCIYAVSPAKPEDFAGSAVAGVRQGKR